MIHHAATQIEDGKRITVGLLTLYNRRKFNPEYYTMSHGPPHKSIAIKRIMVRLLTLYNRRKFNPEYYTMSHGPPHKSIAIKRIMVRLLTLYNRRKFNPEFYTMSHGPPHKTSKRIMFRLFTVGEDSILYNRVMAHPINQARE